MTWVCRQHCWYCNELQNRLPLKVDVEISGEIHDIPSELNTALFRVAQEALTNVVRHANARSAHVQLSYGWITSSLAIEDDGCGIDMERLKLSQRPSWGLLGMEERATLLEVSCPSPRPGLGTRVQVTIPIVYHLKRLFMKIRLLLVDDHMVVRSGLKMLLEEEQDVEIVGEAAAGEALQAVGSLNPDVV
jgi:signal transduction histidine kinase